MAGNAGSKPREWLVANPAGDVVARVAGPERLTILALGNDQAWGLERDEFDIPKLVRFRIKR